MLGTYRIVDLTDERGNLAAFVLAGFGADVVLVEPPGGSAGRRRGPFAGDVVDPERSLTFWGWNRGKRSAVLDLTTDAGQADLAALCADADVVFECGAVPVDLEALRAANPALVTVSITPYGSTGPKAGWPATDLTINAAGCQMAITGDEDRAPLRTSVPQVYLHAAADAAAGALVALTERTASGLGQHVEISAQQSMTQATQSYSLAAALRGGDAQRMSGGIKAGPLNVQLRWPCKDGFVSITFLFGSSIGPFSRRLMEWIHEEGFCDEATRDKDWIEYTAMLYDGREPLSEFERLKGIIGEFCRTKSKDELLQAASDRMLLIAPVTTPYDVLNSKQFAARDYFDQVDDPVLLDGQAVLAPGPYAWSSSVPPLRLGRAPRLGEHTDAVRADPWPQRVAADVASSRDAGAPPQPGERRAPLDGIKVLDMTWAMSGPATTRVMADFGAEVVRIENSRHLDVARTVGPFVDDVPGTDSSGLLFNMSTGKRSISLDLTTAGGRAVLDDLICWADVLVESYSPRGKHALGLETERVRALNPRLIMLSTCLFGQTGPLKKYAGFGTMGASLAGFFHLTGWPDRPPSGPFGAYSDYPSPRLSLCAVLAALEHRRRTGEGQYIDFAQAESCVHFLSPAILDQSVNGRCQSPIGNDDPHMAPHGVYRCAGDDRWVAIACRDDADWQALSAILGRDDLAGLALDERLARREELNAVVETWTAEHTADEAMHAVIDAGVPAHSVQNSSHCMDDPQLAHQGHFVELAHPEHGTVTVETTRMMLSATPGRVHGTPPFLGQDTVDVLTGDLGYDDERLGELFATGALD